MPKDLAEFAAAKLELKGSYRAYIEHYSKMIAEVRQYYSGTNFHHVTCHCKSHKYLTVLFRHVVTYHLPLQLTQIPHQDLEKEDSMANIFAMPREEDPKEETHKTT
jgi:hypothetical protein